MQAQILAPAAVLVCWSIVMLFWAARVRFAALAALGGGIARAKPGGRGRDLQGVIPDEANWKAHNHDHLMEQPTLFYAVVAILAIVGANGWDAGFAWAYVGLRVIHSIYQSTVNRVMVRFRIFAASTLCLIVLALRAAWATLAPTIIGG